MILLRSNLLRRNQICQKHNPQLGLFMTGANTHIGKELEQVFRILDETPELFQVVFDDLTKVKRVDTIRQGLTAEQVLRCAVLKQYRQLSYEELAFHLDDSLAFRRFARLEMGQSPRKSILANRYCERTSRRFQSKAGKQSTSC